MWSDDIIGNTSKRRFHIALPKLFFYLVVYIIIYCLVYPVFPLHDDWYYATSPNPDFRLSDLLPGNTFWRPFDVLFGAFMGYCSQLFPALNRAVVVFAHIMNAVLLDGVTKKMNIGPKWRRFAVCYFLFSSASWAVTLSPDALNQAYSVLFGLLAVYLHLKKGGFQYLPLCLVALLWKESGVSWFFVVPILDSCINGNTWNGFHKNTALVKRFFYQTLLSFLVIIAYFVVRFLLYGSIALGSNSGTYKLSIFSFSAIKNAVLLFASGGSGVDSLALFSNDRSFLLAGITLICSLVFIGSWLICAIRMLIQREHLFTLFCIIICAAGLAFPLMILGSAGEMHAYPVLCAVTILYSFCLDRSQISTKKLAIPIICIFLAFSISSAHKLVSIYDYSSRAQELTKNIQSLYDEPSGPALFVVIDNWDGYSIFNQSAITGTSTGLSMRPYFDWTELDHTLYTARSEEAADTYVQLHQNQYALIFVVRDETVRRVK